MIRSRPRRTPRSENTGNRRGRGETRMRRVGGNSLRAGPSSIAGVVAALDGKAGLGDHGARRGFMNRIEPGFASVPRVAHSACPHDCPSTCALEVEVLDERTIGRVRGAEDNDYTLGVICAKVARYAERVHHPDRLLRPLRRTGPQGSGDFAPISCDDAPALVARNFVAAEP